MGRLAWLTTLLTFALFALPAAAQAGSTAAPVLGVYSSASSTQVLTSYTYGSVSPGGSGVSKTFTVKNTGGSASSATLHDSSSSG